MAIKNQNRTASAATALPVPAEASGRSRNNPAAHRVHGGGHSAEGRGPHSRHWSERVGPAEDLGPTDVPPARRPGSVPADSENLPRKLHRHETFEGVNRLI